MKISAEHLYDIAHKCMLAAGSDEYEAAIVARHMVEANLKGHPSHGAGIFAEYTNMLARGILVPNTPARLTKDAGAILQFAGDGGFGQRIGLEAMDAAITRAKETGICLMTINGSRHLGRIGTYGEQAAAAGMVSIHFVNVQDYQPLVAPFGGKSAVFGTNPICMAMPGTSSSEPIVLDFATSAVAFGKIRVAHLAGKTFDEPVVVDGDGKRTNSPEPMFDPNQHAAMIPFGGHKGGGLALIAELFGGLMSGGGTIQPEHEKLGAITNNMATIVIDPGNLADTSWWSHELTAMLDYMKASPAGDPTKPVLTPGELERSRKTSQLKDGIEFSAGEWESLTNAGVSVGLSKSDFEV